MAGEAEEARGPVLAGVRVIAHVVGDLAQVGVEYDGAVELDFDLRAADGDLLEVPLADGTLIAAVRGDHAVGGAVVLAGIELGVFRRRVVENLQLAHADVGRVAAAAGKANGETVVA